MAVDLAFERALWSAGARIVAGIDEVGRGALAGPVSVGVCALAECESWPVGLDDSKAVPESRRAALAAQISQAGWHCAVGHAQPAEIDRLGMTASLRLAAERALDSLAERGVVPDAVLLDGKHDWLTRPHADLFSADADDARANPPVTTVIKGDGACVSIAAASIVAKVERDSMMVSAHSEWPQFGWDSNKGYGAEMHLEALRVHGPSPLHRLSWKLPDHETAI